MMMATVADSSEVYRRHADELVRYATALVGPTHAPDVVVDAVVTAFASASWSTVENRREQRVAVSDAVVVGDSSVDAQRALAGLSPQQRAVVYLTYWDDLTPTQVAGLLGVSDGTVRKQLARAREQLRRILQ